MNEYRRTVDNLPIELYCYYYTVGRLLSGHLLSGHPLLSGQLSKSQNYCQYNTVNKTPVKRPPLLSGRGHLFGGPHEGSPVVFIHIKRPPTRSLAFEKTDDRQEFEVKGDD